MRMVFNVCLSFIATLLFPIFVADSSILFSYSHFSIIFMAGIYAVLQYSSKQETDGPMWAYLSILGIFLSLMTSCGYYLETVKSVPYFNLRWIAAVAVYSVIYKHLFKVLWIWLKIVEKDLRNGKCEKFATCSGRLFDKLFSSRLFLVLIFLTCWIPCYLSSYPGFFFSDATKEYMQSVNGYLAEFPMLHSVIIIKLLNAGYWLTGSYNTGIAIYVISQMVLLALLFAHILAQFWKHGKNGVLLGIVAGYFALFPVIHVLVTTSARDILFSGLLTWLVFQIYELAENPADFFLNALKPIILGLTISFAVFARSNFVGIFAFTGIAVAAALIWFLCKKHYSVDIRSLSISFAGSYIILGCILMAICSPLGKADTSNYLSILTQPITRAYVYEQENWTDAQRQRFDEYFDLDKIYYVAENADSTKSYCDVDSNTLLPFLRFWCSMGMRYPNHYLDGILANTMQMWFPGGIVDGYAECKGWNAEKTFFFVLDYIEHPGTHMQYFPGVRDFYHKLGMCISYEKIPVISMLFSIGFHFWCVVNSVFYLTYRKEYRSCIPLVILLVYAMVSALTPLVYLRYYAALFMAFPIVVVLTLQPKTSVEVL